MKGIVFTEFLELIEAKFGFDTVDAILESAAPLSGGSYTTVGTYDHRELAGLVAALSKKVGVPAPELLKEYGRHLFGRFVAGFPVFFEDATDPLEFLTTVEAYIHVEVRKLYPDAELPVLDHEHVDGGLELTYRSPRPFGSFAAGLVEGCLDHFGGTFQVESDDQSTDAETRVLFRIR